MDKKDVSISKKAQPSNQDGCAFLYGTAPVSYTHLIVVSRHPVGGQLAAALAPMDHLSLIHI